MSERLNNFVRPFLADIGDGRWHNLLRHEDRVGDGSVREWLLQGFRAGVARALDLVEIDDTWARLTEAGRRALSATPDRAQDDRAALQPAGELDEASHLIATGEKIARRIGATFVVDPVKLAAFRRARAALQPAGQAGTAEGGGA